MHIQSPRIKKALREVIKTYLGVKLQAPVIVLRDTLKCLFHYRREIADYARTLEDPVAREHIRYVQDYAYQQMVQPMLSFTLNVEFVENEQPGLEFQNLWMAFRPGDLIFSKDRDVPRATPRVYRFERMQYTSKSCRIEADYIESDATSFGYRPMAIDIDIYDNYKAFTQLVAYPLEYHPENASLIEHLTQRGAQYVLLQGIHDRSFAGDAYAPCFNNGEEEDDDEYPPVPDETTATALVSGSPGFVFSTSTIHNY